MGKRLLLAVQEGCVCKMGGKVYITNALGRLVSNLNGAKSCSRLGGKAFTDRRVRGFSCVPTFESNLEGEQLKASTRFTNSNWNIRYYSKHATSDIKTVMNFYEFSEIEDKNKKTFNEMISLYEEKFKTRKGVVDFILSALKHMKEFGVEEDLETYKRMINLMPKGKFVPTNRLQVEFMHFPREQDCILEVLCQMEDLGVMPDVEVGKMLCNIFGEIGIPTRKFYRMMYWMPKFKHLSPWPLPKPLPKDTFTIAKLAIERITSVDLQTKITVFRTEDVEESIDKTWIVSGQSPTQRELLKKHDRGKPLIVEGGDHVWIRRQRVNYFVLKSEEVPYEDVPPESENDLSGLDIRFFNPNYKEKEVPSVHEQEDGIIYAVCATGTSKKDSLLSWIRLLQQNGNPIIGDLAVLFRFKTPPQEVVPFSDEVTIRDEAKKAVTE